MVGEVGEPAFGLASNSGDGEVRMQHNDAGLRTISSVAERHRQASSAAVAEVGCESTNLPHLRRAEPVRRVGAMQAEKAPTTCRCHERRPELVAQAERCHDLAVSSTVDAVPAGGGVQSGDMSRRRGE